MSWPYLCYVFIFIFISFILNLFNYITLGQSLGKRSGHRPMTAHPGDENCSIFHKAYDNIRLLVTLILPTSIPFFSAKKTLICSHGTGHPLISRRVGLPEPWGVNLDWSKHHITLLLFTNNWLRNGCMVILANEMQTKICWVGLLGNFLPF